MTLFESDRIRIIPFNRHFEENERDIDLKSFFCKAREPVGHSELVSGGIPSLPEGGTEDARIGGIRYAGIP